MSFSLTDSQAFKVNALALIDRIKLLGGQCLQLGKIGYVIMDQQVSVETILNNSGSFVSIIQKVIDVKQKLTKYMDIICSSNNMIRSLEEILATYQDLNEEQRKISNIFKVQNRSSLAYQIFQWILINYSSSLENSLEFKQRDINKLKMRNNK